MVGLDARSTMDLDATVKGATVGIEEVENMIASIILSLIHISKADITIAGFETTDRKDFYDLAVGNVPFGQYQVDDLSLIHI